MRHIHIYLFGSAVLVAACQPLTPTTINTKAAPTITVGANDQTEIQFVVNTITKIADGGAGSVTDPVTDSGSSAESSSGTSNKTDETAIAAIPAAPTVQPAPVKQPFHPKAMIGSASILLIRDLGIASIIRKEGPVEIWQYRFAACVVDFFFYPASEGSSQLVIKEWNMRSAVIGSRINEGKCLAAMDRHHQKLVTRS